MAKVKRLIEQTRHTGEFSYLIGQARTGVNYPVLEDVLDGRYKNVVAQSPFVAGADLFYGLYEPTRAMHQLATDLFHDYLGRPNRKTTRDVAIWRLLHRIHNKLKTSTPESQAQADELLPKIARKFSIIANASVAHQSLAITAAVYLQTGILSFPNALTAAVNTVTLLVMHGVPRERVAYFGIYYQDPTKNSHTDLAWSQGLYLPAPFHIITGVYIGGKWIPFDFTQPLLNNSQRLPKNPAPYLHGATAGISESEGTKNFLDYAHPYTMIFSPPMSGQQNISPLLKHIPRLATA